METQAGDLDHVVAMLLRSRVEAKATLASVEGTLARVEGALVALGVDLDDPELAEPTPELIHQWKRIIHTQEGIPRQYGNRQVHAERDDLLTDPPKPPTAGRVRPVRQLVMEILDERHAWMTNAEVAEIVMKQLGGNRPEDKIKSNVRSSLWSLRQKGEVVERDGKNMALKWLTDTDAAPADAETASGSSPTTIGEGGASTNASDAHGLRDQDPLWKAELLDHRHGASVAEVPR